MTGGKGRSVAYSEYLRSDVWRAKRRKVVDAVAMAAAEAELEALV